VPTIFLKLTSALNGPRSTVVLPKLTQQPDYEAEFAFVIGTGGKSISAAAWEEHVFGYTIMNDVSARDVQMSTSRLVAAVWVVRFVVRFVGMGFFSLASGHGFLPHRQLTLAAPGPIRRAADSAGARPQRLYCGHAPQYVCRSTGGG